MPGHDLRTALVTGASSGIGTALSQLLARHGITVALVARRPSELQKVADAIAAEGGKSLVVPADVSDAAAVGAAVQRAEEELGGLDLVVANAGVAVTRWSGKLTWSDCADMIGVNVVGATATLVSAIPGMLARGRGHLVGVSSLAAYRGLPKLAVYSASKAYLSSLLEALRIDLAEKGITVSDVRPGYVRTAMNANTQGKMPLSLDADQAAQEIFDAILAKKALHAFPLPVAGAMRSMSWLPIALYDKVAAKLV
jgi:short-subunit dehydrogenase